MECGRERERGHSHTQPAMSLAVLVHSVMHTIIYSVSSSLMEVAPSSFIHLAIDRVFTKDGLRGQPQCTLVGISKHGALGCYEFS